MYRAVRSRSIATPAVGRVLFGTQRRHAKWFELSVSLAILVITRPADEAGRVDAVTAARTAYRRRRRGRSVCVFGLGVLAVESTAAAGDGVHRSTANAQAHGDFTLSEPAIGEQSIDLLNECGGEHGAASEKVS